jgi:DNA-binding NarL/FixJ family response regulator
MKLRVLLADDSAMIREILRMILEMAPDIDVVGEVGNGRDVLIAVDKTSPDVVCMDINMPGMNGIEATQQLLAVHPNVKVIGLSVHTDHAQVADIIAAGARGYVVKEDAGSEMLSAIRAVCRCQTYFSRSLGDMGFAER